MKGIKMLALFAALLLAVPALADDHPARLRYFTQKPEAVGSTTAYGANAAAGHFVRSGDARIYYEIYGEGPPLLVLHGGGPGSPYELGTMLDALRPHFKVIVVSSRGHGRSEIGHTPVSLAQKADDVLAVLQAVTNRAVPILGFSDGAYTACTLAARHPEQVERLVAIGAGTLQPGHFPPEMKVEDIEKLDKAFVEQQKRLMPEPGRLQEFWTAYMGFWNKAQVGRETFGAIRCPVLFVAGDEDDHAPVASVLAAHQMTPKSRLCIVPKAGHATFLDNFPVTWIAVEHFLRAEVKALGPSKKLPQNDCWQHGQQDPADAAST